MKGVLEMQRKTLAPTNKTNKKPRVRETCATCGGDPGGLVWEGVVLSGVLTAADIALLMSGAIEQRGIVHLFATGRLRGTKLGKWWVTTASKFIEDWERIEGYTPSHRRRRARKKAAAEVREMEVASR